MAKKNDIYYGDLRLIKKRVNEWAALHPKSKLANAIKYGTVVIGFAAMIGAYLYNPVDASKNQISLFTATIFFAFVIMIVVSRKINSILQPPFAKLYNARFEASDDGIYCYYQQKMAEYCYHIKDKNLKEWIIDADASCMYISGTASMSRTTREGTQDLGKVSAFYMLIPFDQYDLDDLVEPYSEFIKYKNGTMREQFTKEGVNTLYIPKDDPYKAKKLNS